jgi:hypothetical protein
MSEVGLLISSSLEIEKKNCVLKDLQDLQNFLKQTKENLLQSYVRYMQKRTLKVQLNDAF